MQLLFTDEQKLLGQFAKKFFANEWNLHLVRTNKINQPFWEKLADLGWTTMLIEEEDGGSGSSLIEQGIVLEQAGYRLCSPVLYTTVQAALLCKQLNEKEISQQLTTGKSAVFAMGNLLGKTKTLASKQLDNTWTLMGEEAFIPFANEADLIFINAKTPEGYGIFLVEKSEIEFRKQQTFGAQGLMVLKMNNVKAHCLSSSVLPEQLVNLQLQFAALQAIEMVGGMQSVIDQTVQYVNERKQFEAPIGSFQAVQHHLANMYSAYRGARLLAYKALFLFDHNDAEAEKFARMAKIAANEAYREITITAHQLWGGNGYSLETDLQLWSNRAVTTSLTLGTSLQHKQALIEQLKTNRRVEQQV